MGCELCAQGIKGWVDLTSEEAGDIKCSVDLIIGGVRKLELN